MSERPALVTETRESQPTLKVLRRYLPDIFVGSANSIRASFAESSITSITEINDNEDPRRLIVWGVDASRPEKLYLLNFKSWDKEFKWEVRAFMGNVDHNVQCLWQGERSVEELELTLEDRFGVHLTVKVDSGAGTIKVGPKEHKISLYQGFNDLKFDELRRKHRISDTFRLFDGAILDESNLFVLSYTVGSTIKKETLILPARLTQPLLEV